MKKTVSIVAVNALILIALLLIVEFFLRWYVTFDPGYYTGVKSGSSCINYPYGTVCLNSHNFPDTEFTLSSEGSYRIGYIGDSVCYGVGAGQEQRITEQIKHQLPAFVHMNFCYIGENVISNETMAGTLKIVDKYSLDHVVYLMNLNDISPLQVEMGMKDQGETNGLHATSSIDEHANVESADRPILVKVKSLLMPIDEGLRGRSYLYTWIRNKMKEYLTVAGYEASGYKAIELFPAENAALFQYAADKITWLNEQLSMQGVNFTLVVLPYEMQTSKHAATVYRDLRINWEEGFTDGSAQQLLLSSMSKNVNSIDARYAFDGVRETAHIGEYFVYDKGDKIDWNHPNHAGHRKIADFIVQQQPFSKADLHH